LDRFADRSRAAAKLLTKDEARRIAVIAKLPSCCGSRRAGYNRPAWFLIPAPAGLMIASGE
jgi:hypothetical protein